MSKDKPIVQVFIATYNRASLVSKAINSVTNQTFKSIEIIISDNSTNDETGDLIQNNCKNNIIYRKRIPSLNAIDHFNLILNEVSSDYFMIFHDDDQMLPNMIQSYIDYINLNNENEFIAIGANAFIMKKDRVTKNIFGENIKYDEIITSPTDLVKKYFLKKNIVPLTSYLYKKEVANSIKFNYSHGKKHCDVSFLLDVSSHGNVINIQKPLMIINEHDNQDTKGIDFIARTKLINYIVLKTNFQKKDKLVIKYRLKSIYLDACQTISQNKSYCLKKRYFKIYYLFLKYGDFELFSKLLVKTILTLLHTK